MLAATPCPHAPLLVERDRMVRTARHVNHLDVLQRWYGLRFALPDGAALPKHSTAAELLPSVDAAQPQATLGVDKG